MSGEWAEDRTVLRITGADAQGFLQGLITNDVGKAGQGLVYAALLTPQGKYLFDFFLARDGDGFLLDVQTDRAGALAQRLSMYRLRADVQITKADLQVNRGLGDMPEEALADPRHAELGWRVYTADKGKEAAIGWDAIRVAHCVPETGIELFADSSYILEAGFEALNGVDFRKGCYVGQEVTARMKHKTELRKGLRVVQVAGAAPVGSEIKADGKLVGTLFTQSGGQGIAYLRLDRVADGMMAGEVAITLK